MYEKTIAPKGTKVSLQAGEASFKITERTETNTIIAQISVYKRVILYYFVKKNETVL